MTIKLATTQAQFEGLHSAAATTRKGTETVKVEKAALEALLLDHSKMAAQLGRNVQEA